ncbi:MAG: fibronectin type III domain-containing protein, partial [Clostridia bacterium]|nr:fibronectin type III domain-containing protein [Clostridia bacterium]
YTDGALRWPTLQNAHAYEITVNGQIVAEANSGTKYIFDAENQNFEVSIRAIGNGSSTVSGAPSATKRFVYLSPVTGVRVVEGVVVWDAVSGAEGYKVKVNGNILSETFSAEEREYKGLVAGSECRISVIPTSTDTVYFSSWSTEQTVKILSRPIIMWNSAYKPDGTAMNNCYWDGVDGAAGYKVYITRPNGDVDAYNLSENERAIAEAFLEAGEYTVEVQALAAANQDNTYDSQRSKPFSVCRLASPEADGAGYITSNSIDITYGFTARFRSVSGAREYEIFRDGTSLIKQNSPVFSVGNVVDSSVIEEQSFSYYVKAIGFTDVSNSRAVLDSLTEDANSFYITVLAAPTNLNMSGYNFSYETVNGAHGYYISTGAKLNGYTTNETTFNLGNILNAGGYDVSVCAEGNGSDVLPSNYAPALRVVRLDAPAKITINFEGQDEGHLNISAVTGARSYMVVFDNDEGSAAPVTDLGNVSNRISEQGTTIHATATANEWQGNIYYMTSKASDTFNFVKLAKPTFGNAPFNNTQIFWNAPSNINTQSFVPGYRVTNSQNVAYNGEKSGTSMQISYLEGGMEYEFRVIAIGDGERYVNSEPSDTVTVYKLATPKISRTENGYQWNAVARAVSYAIKVDGVIMETFSHETDKTYVWAPKGLFTKVGEYKITVEAIGDGGRSTIDAKPAEEKQITIQLASPEFTYSYNKEQYTKDGKIIVEITPVDYANGYTVYIGGTEHSISRDDITVNSSGKVEFSFTPNSTGEYKIGVAVLGGLFNANKEYCLTSQTTGNNDRYKLTLLASTGVASFSLGQDGYLEWDAVDGAFGYKVYITVDGVVIEGYFTTKTASITFDSEMLGGKKFSEISSLTVTVVSMGNGTTVVDSDSEATYTWNNL